MVLSIDGNPNIEDPKDARNVFYFSFVIAWITIVLFAIWSGVFLLNTVYLGAQLYNVGWWLLLFLSFNVTLPLSLVNSLTNPKSISRADINFLISWVMFFFNIVVLVSLLFFWFFFLNTVFSGFLPFNSYLWCCVYTSSSYCTSTPPLGPCVPAVSYMDISPNSDFYWTLGFTAAFFILSIFFIGINKLLRTAGIVTSTVQNGLVEGRKLGLSYLLIYVIVYILWAGVSLLNTINTSQNFYYWLQFVLAFNVVPVYGMLLALLNRTGSMLWPYFYLISTIIMAIFDGIIFLIIVFYVIFNIQDPVLIQTTVYALFFTLLNAFGIWIYFRMKVYGAIQ